MRCPFCDFGESKVIDSRPLEDNNSIRRRRECLKCAKRFTTREILEEISITVLKKDGRQEKYDRQKILRGMFKATEKRSLAPDVVEEAVNKVEKEIRALGEREISSKEIGRLVAERLKELDQVAYIRFISVYNRFADVNNFMQEIETLVTNPEKDQREK
ncbi:MAG: transcriptional regulator NrdR [Sporomusaceae bacterium]|jgi:transcriptional repressor NrdR|nr:transcriptional regulator NrdR [Sporomusaceae bacterium]